MNDSTMHKFEGQLDVVRTPSTESHNAHYISNRLPLKPSVLIKLPVGAVKPAGWLLEFLRRQKEGLTGHLGEISAWLQKEDNAWLQTNGKGKWGWEEVPYWLKGYANLGYLLEDPEIVAEAMIWIESALKSQREDGDFGPDFYFTEGSGKGYRDYWSNMIMLFCLQSYYEYSKDQRVIDLMTRYFQYQLTVPDEAMLSGYWDHMRGGDNLFSIYWLYNRTGEAFLLELAEKIHHNTANWKMEGTLPNWHNVNVAQCFNEPATFYQQSHDPTDLRAAYDNFNIIREQYGQMPGGMFAADENAREGFDDPHQCVETCGMVEQMLSDEQLLGVTGDIFWADQCEDVAFNTYPAAVMPDFKALRYLTAPNQVLSDSQNHSPGVQNEGPFFLMNPFSSRCCQHNHSHGWPYYVEHSWFATPDNGLAAVLYSAGTVTAMVGNGTTVSINEETHYPFEEQITFTLSTPQTVEFPLYLRIPGWCENPLVAVNGQQIKASAKPGHYLRIANCWNDGDQITLQLPMSIKIRHWTKNHNSVSVDRGPLTYSMKIEEHLVKVVSDKTAIYDSKWQKDADVSCWPSWEIHPASPWNYGLVLNQEYDESAYKIIRRQWPADDMPFTLEGTPIVLIAKGKRIPSWTLDENQMVGELWDGPVNSDQAMETITLVPMGAARLRISAFPVVEE